MSAIELPFHERFSLAAAETARPSLGARLLGLYVPMLWLIDITIVVASFLLAYRLRFVGAEEDAAALTIAACIKMSTIVAVALTVIFAQQGLYDRERLQSSGPRAGVVISSLSIALVVAVTLSYFAGDERYSRLWFAGGWVVAAVSLTAWRWIAGRAYARARGALLPASRVIIVGANPAGRDLACDLTPGYEVVGFVDNGSDVDAATTGPVLLGPIAELERFVHAHAVDEIFIVLPPDRREQIGQVISRGFRRRVAVRFLPDVGALALPRRAEMRHVGNRPVIAFAAAARITVTKRIVDVVITAAALVALLPLLAAIAAAIKLDSDGPVLYRQIRVGKDGRRFRMVKFRSMRRDAEAMLDLLLDANEAIGPLFKLRYDPRITRVGAFLRRYSLDELPQLLNVLRGEMSLVGPRPPLPKEVEAYEEWQLGRLRAVPGMTGLWQVSGRSEVPFQDMVRLDLHYIRNWSVGLDLQIIARTIPAVLTNRGAY